MLISIALLPIITPNIWHKHFGKITLVWTKLLIYPMIFYFGFNLTIKELTHIIIAEYIPFIIILWALFTITGGIHIKLQYKGHPIINTIILSIATLSASLIGTTGAAMLFIRPLILINSWRQYKTHIIIFFIFLVCNIGGALTAIGDPPLFMGFILGIDFFWPTKNLLLPFLYMTIPLLILFIIIDTIFYIKNKTKYKYNTNNKKIKITGYGNCILLISVIIIIIISGFWKTNIKFNLNNSIIYLEHILRDTSLLILGFLSLNVIDQSSRKKNFFTWNPLIEVMKLFAGIFITILPIINIINQRTEGKFSPIIKLVTNDFNEPINYLYFWITGILSAFLDNTPTYLIFFHLAGGDPETLMNNLNKTLITISTASVFMGALTYIGNAPNFIVKSIAETYNINMPSFIGYLCCAIFILGPLLYLIATLFT